MSFIGSDSFQPDVAGRTNIYHSPSVGNPAHHFRRISGANAVLDSVQRQDFDRFTDGGSISKLTYMGLALQSHLTCGTVYLTEFAHRLDVLIIIHIYRTEISR